MAIDLSVLKNTLAEHKVYDAWQYVESLRETLGYMNVSHEMLNTVYSHRIETLRDVEQEIFNKAVSEGKASFGTSELDRTDLNIGGFIIDDIVFLKKTSMEFFHYARVSMEVLFQIVNAALLGDAAFDVDDKGLLRKLLREPTEKPEFATLLSLMDATKDELKYQYLTAFDNYIKHIKTILITISNSILIGNKNVFMFNEFCYDGTFYSSENAIDKISELNEYVLLTVDTILCEVLVQTPNCFDNTQRIQSIRFRQVFHEESGKQLLQYISFFIEVETDLTDLPQEIKVMPLIIKPNGEIYSFDFKFDKISIKKKNTS